MEVDFEKQFLDVYKQNADAIFRYCLLRVSDRELAKDIAQDTFTKVWQYAAKGEKIENLRAFLYTTARNLIIDHYRKKQATSLDNMMEQGFDVGIDPHQPLMDRLDGEKALALLGSIPEKYRDAIYLQYVEGLSVKEIAQITSETENNISVRIHRGLQKLRMILREQHGEQ
ncbi:MAG TPA: RNA polymerase sigma factor [Candidatus Nanoarchaeia archaeon]|nr:RNA polymerase sigma factor [Candidatus Nanoarchaeia archaeon]